MHLVEYNYILLFQSHTVITLQLYSFLECCVQLYSMGVTFGEACLDMKTTMHVVRPDLAMIHVYTLII